jgi:hypothetical protein
MWTLPRPNISARTAFRTAISRVADPNLKARFESIEGIIVGASNDFEAAAAATSLHTLALTDNVGGRFSNREMAMLYDRRFARKGSPGRPIYDGIFAAAKRCPLCGHGTVSTLDHHLPKAHYGALAVAPLNLVPACSDCNKNKIDILPLVSEDETLHPYFDDIEDDLWLIAEVIETTPVALCFTVQAPGHWGHTLSARVRQHFRMLHLANLYGAQAATETSNIREYLTNLLNDGGAADVRAHLADMADSCASHRINSWQTATYTALSESDWYCGGGFI